MNSDINLNRNLAKEHKSHIRHCFSHTCGQYGWWLICLLHMADMVFHVAGMVVEYVDDVVCGHWPIWMSFVC